MGSGLELCVNTVTERLRAAVDTADGERPIVEITGYDDTDIDDRRRLSLLHMTAAAAAVGAVALSVAGAPMAAAAVVAVGALAVIGGAVRFGLNRRPGGRRRPPTTGVVLTDRQLLVAKGDDEPMALPADRVTGFAVAAGSTSFGRDDGGSDVSVETLDGELTVSVNAVAPKTIEALLRADAADAPVDDLIPVPPTGDHPIFITGWLREPSLVSIVWVALGAALAIGALVTAASAGVDEETTAEPDAARVVVLEDGGNDPLPLADAAVALTEAATTVTPTTSEAAEVEVPHSGALVDLVDFPDLGPLGCDVDLVDEPRLVEGRVVYLHLCGGFAPTNFQGAGDYMPLCVDPRWADRLPGAGSGPVLRCDDDLMSFDPATGDLRWALAPRSSIVQVRLTTERGVIQLEDSYGVIDTASGDVLWETFHGEDEGRVAISDDLVFEPNEAGVIARDVETGEARWTADVIGIRSLMAGDQRLYITTELGLLHVLDLATGAIVDSAEVPGPASLRAVGGGLVAVVSGGELPILTVVERDGLAQVTRTNAHVAHRVRITDAGFVVVTHGRSASIEIFEPGTGFWFEVDGAVTQWHTAIDGTIVHMGLANGGTVTPLRAPIDSLYEQWEAQQ
ncbi:MAG: PQQ-binding-like beta-propeller repeat protein [Actinomycetota bacterium]